MSGPKRNPDKLNTIGVVVVGICGAVLVYVTILALQAFYMDNTSEIDTMADYGGQDVTAKGHKAGEMRNITEAGKNAAVAGQQETFRIPIEHAMKLVVESAKQDPAHLIPALPASDKASIEPVFGRPSAAPPAAEGSAAPAGTPGAAAGSAATEPGAPAVTVPMSPTGGTPGQPQPVPGAGSQPTAQPTTPATTTAPTTTTQPKAPAATRPKATPRAQPRAAGSAQPKAAGSAQPKTP